MKQLAMFLITFSIPRKISLAKTPQKIGLKIKPSFKKKCPKIFFEFSSYYD